MEIQVFDPVLYSHEENLFLLNHLGEAPIVAMRGMPSTVNAKAVKPILERVFELNQLSEHSDATWVGIEALKEAIKIFFRENTKWANDAKRSRKAPRWPSLFSYDAKGRPHKGGPGSDAGRVRTYFGPAGERIPFAVQLIPDGMGDWQAPGFTEKPLDAGLKEDPVSNRIECLVPIKDPLTGANRPCGHTESYRGESRASHAAARARMSKHLRKATENVEGHRELYTNEFGE